MRRGFTLIELLVICAILATMTAIGVGSIVSGQGMARVKGATRDVYAAIRHARSVALVTGQRVLVNYSNETVDDEPAVKIEVVSAKIMSADSERKPAQPYYVKEYKELAANGSAGQGQELVHIRGSEAKPFASEGEAENGTAAGETLEEILFSPMDASVVKGMRILVKKGDEALTDETAVQTRSRISVFSNVDYLQNRYKEAKQADAAKKEEQGGSGKDSASPLGGSATGSVNDMDETVSVVWETNGAVEPHRIWIYPDGKKPEDGLQLNIDSFGAVKVLDGDGREED